jgi:ribose 5-phosphate isomerase RpiB
LAIAAEPMLEDYLEVLRNLLKAELETEVLDMNEMPNWNNTEELVGNCIDKVLSGSVDFVVLVSQSGNGLQIIANKNEHIRAAPIPNDAFVNEAIAVDANMCEVCSTTQEPESACDLIVKFAHARKITRR